MEGRGGLALCVRVSVSQQKHRWVEVKLLLEQRPRDGGSERLLDGPTQELAQVCNTRHLCCGWQSWRGVTAQAICGPENGEFQTSNTKHFIAGFGFCFDLFVTVPWFFLLK